MVNGRYFSLAPIYEYTQNTKPTPVSAVPFFKSSKSRNVMPCC